MTSYQLKNVHEQCQYMTTEALRAAAANYAQRASEYSALALIAECWKVAQICTEEADRRESK